MKLLFEKSVKGRRCAVLPPCDVPAGSAHLSANLKRETPPVLPELSECDVVRHFIALSRRAHGVDNGFYPLGSCTMKYNPRVNEETAALPGFTDMHPLQPQSTVQGCLELMYKLQKSLIEVTGMDGMTLQPAAGAHGEWTSLMMIKAYHAHRGDTARTKVIVPDSAHGTNPASASMAGFTVVSIPSREDGCVDPETLKAAVGPDTAAFMMTNPNTLGLFEKEIESIAKIIHEAGGLLYYDGANLNAVMGKARPGDMGFDVVHLNLHKTFSTPHGGGGPGAGAVGCKKALIPFLPHPVVVETKDGYALDDDRPLSIGRVKSFYGNFLVDVKAYTYILSLGGKGLKEASEFAVLNANYMLHHFKEIFELDNHTPCMHEFVMSMDKLKKETGISALDVAKALLDNGIHPPTIYFPLIVHEAMMFEPTETESLETLDEAIAVMKNIKETAYSNPESLHQAPLKTPVRRLDEVSAARNPRLKF